MDNSTDFVEVKIPYSRLWIDEFSAVNDDKVFSEKVKSYVMLYKGAAVSSINNNIDLIKAMIWTGPIIDMVGPNAGVPGTSVTIIGSGYGDSQGSSIISLNGVALTVLSWSTDRIVVVIPSGASSGLIEVTVGGQKSNGVNFAITTDAWVTITSLLPSFVRTGETFIINGSGFGSDPGAGKRATAANHIVMKGIKVADSSILSWSDSTIAIIVPSLPDGQYPVQVRANDKESNTISLTIYSGTLAIPNPPTDLMGNAVSSSVIVWSWKDNSINEQGFNLYDNAGIKMKDTGASETTIIENNLLPNTLYQRVVRSFNPAGESTGSNLAQRYTLANKVTDLAAIAKTTQSISLSWKAGLGGATQYNIYRANDISGNPGPVTKIKVGVTTTSYTDSGLKENTSYWYGVVAVNGDNVESLYDLVLMKTGSDTIPPDITNMIADDKRVLSGDIIKAVPVLTASITDNVKVDEMSIIAKITTESGSVFEFDRSSMPKIDYDSSSGIMSLKLVDALPSGAITLKLFAKDISGNLREYTIGLKVAKPGTYIDGDSFNFPNPFNPLKETTKIGFSISTDTEVTIYMFNTIGQIIKKFNISAKTGYNEVEWDGKNDYNEFVGNGVYLGRIVSDNKLLGKLKIRVIKQ